MPLSLMLTCRSPSALMPLSSCSHAALVLSFSYASSQEPRSPFMVASHSSWFRPGDTCSSIIATQFGPTRALDFYSNTGINCDNLEGTPPAPAHNTYASVL